ncbi:MAG: 23S rRNA (pseudouridine(1915)-N(3))-methyltransferase RlmH [Oscillospiraceae bacterium]|nr:23S rRNA (pseudouridine(1915)-N(3))-methyltransferase RlmH [Oscillospiraceae bacterium]
MLRIRIICVGKLKERFYADALAEYEKRLAPFCRLELIELPEERLGDRPKAGEIENALMREGERIEKQLLRDAQLVCLCVEGRQMDSPAFSELLRSCEASGHPRICFVIGGSFGLSEELKRKADRRLSMSEMTFPHHLARVMLIEQIYRGFQIKEGTPYHK